MELRHLRYFVQVATDLHFARAAQHLGISQPPLSQQIRALEDELGVRLFDRTSRRVILTPAGKTFLVAAQEVLHKADQAVSIARRTARGVLGELSIAFNASAPFVPQVAKAIHDFRQAYPDVVLHLAEAGAAQQIEAVQDHSLDIGFLRAAGRPPVPRAITALPLLSEGMMVAMRPDHRLAAAGRVEVRDLAGEPLLLYARDHNSSFTEGLLALMRAAGVEPIVAQAVTEVSTLFGLAATGIGVAVMSASLCTLQPARLVYLPLDDPAAQTTMWMIHRADDPTLACRHFLDLVARDQTP